MFPQMIDVGARRRTARASARPSLLSTGHFSRARRARSGGGPVLESRGANASDHGNARSRRSSACAGGGPFLETRPRVISRERRSARVSCSGS